jgi:cell wall-associated NlpC family hydrolase
MPSSAVRRFALVMTIAALSACGSRTAVPRPFPVPPPSHPRGPVLPPDAPAAAAAAPAAEPVLHTALSLLGVPYRPGGNDPAGFDCSGFVTYVFARHGVALPRTVESQARAGGQIGRPAAGDLVFFRTSGRGPTHVGIALGPDRFIHAPSTRGVVRIEMLGSPYWSERYLEARRVLGP